MSSENTQALIKMYKEHILGMVSPPTTCEACGKDIPTRANAINTNNVSYVFNAQIGSPGHPALPYLQCPVADNGEHWACSPDCWHKVATDCITNHQKPILDHFHEKLNGGTTNGNNANTLRGEDTEQ